MEVVFYSSEEIADCLLKFAVIAAQFENKWIFCRHKARNTWEIPGGHREFGETIEDAARRELWEETGATQADIRKVCVYGVRRKDEISYGMLFFAEITDMGSLPSESEIGETFLSDDLPSQLTYPGIQPHLYEKVLKWRDMQTGADGRKRIQKGRTRYGSSIE